MGYVLGLAVRNARLIKLFQAILVNIQNFTGLICILLGPLLHLILLNLNFGQFWKLGRKTCDIKLVATQ